MESVEQIAATVLYEGFLLYPYRRSAMKNQQRWTFGGVYPRSFSEWSGGHDPWAMQTQCLITGDQWTRLVVKIRFLQVVDRTVLQEIDGARRPVEELRVGQEAYRPWEESVEREAETHLLLGELGDRSRSMPIDIPGGQEEEELYGPDGTSAGALLRTWQPIREEVDIRGDRLSRQAEDSGAGLFRLTVRISNRTEWEPADGTGNSQARNSALRRASISTHTILQVEDGEFVSLLEPPEEYAAAAAECANLHTWPVLAGESGDRHVILSSPIILYDYPQVSIETPGDLFDATEIDELLRFSIMTLTDEEKQEMRESDPRSREILERTESLRPDELLSLHASVRALQIREPGES